MKVVPLTPRDGTPAWGSPVDAINEFAADATSGKIKPVKVLILWFEEVGEEKRLRPNRWYQNCSTCEAIALLEAAKQQELEQWREG